MEMFDTLKSVYGSSDEKILLADENMKIVWRNKDTLPEFLDTDNIRLPFGRAFELPITKSETCEYKGGFGSSCALKIEPLFENETVCGYLLHLFSCEDIEIISDRSGHLKYKNNYLGNIRIEMSRLINMLDRRLKNEKDGSENLMDFDREARCGVLKTLSATVNYSELSKYYSGFFSGSFMNISVALEELCGDIAPLMEKYGVKFGCNIQPAVYIEMNADRLKAAAANLIVNAVMYNSKPDKLCEVTLSSDDSGVEIVVSDNGDGMEPDVPEKAKQPFGYFSEYDRREFMGLAVVNKCCEFFGGKLEIATQKGMFTEVKMWFPKPEREIPMAFRKTPFPPVPNPYDTVNAILAKAFNTF